VKAMMADKLTYIHLPTGSEPPQIMPTPCRMAVLVEDDVGAEWQVKISKWIVDSGCLYMLAWGKDCSSWDDSVDHANLEDFDYGEIPDDKFVMTSWLETGPIEEALWHCRHVAFHPTLNLPFAFIIHIASHPRANELSAAYWKDNTDEGEK
jgi:hypothetical protein